jgi:DNA-binding MarR family transcriptional regulator
MIEGILRPYDLGSTQWYVLFQLANHGPTPQRDFPALLQIEKPTLSEVVRALVRKGFVDQVPDAEDQRQRVLALTDTGRAVWNRLPDPIARILEIAFAGVDAATLETVTRVLRTATERLNTHIEEGTAQ